MKRGIGLLNSRQQNLELLQVDEIKYLPPLFRKFISLYDLGYDMLNPEKVKTIGGDLESVVAIGMFDNFPINGELYNATIDLVFDFDQLREEYDKYINKEDYWHDKGLMKIGLLFHGDVLLLGIEENNKDEIWRYGSGLLNTTSCKLDDDIFAFFSRLNEYIDPDKLQDLNCTINQLYKKWGEDFWRVRENESA